MTPKNHVLVLIVIIAWIDVIAATAFSKVVVQRSDGVPVNYISYNPSSLSFADSQIAQISAPLESVISVPSTSAILSPCLAPCVIPNVPASGLAPIPTTNSKIVTYKSSIPNIPVVVTNNEAPRGYQYAYSVYDDQTGDKKYQSEHSDGSVVQGQYSFIQPDGIRREVVYTADDLKGFNAIVRNISPEPNQDKEGKGEVVKPQQAPCSDTKNEHLTLNPSSENVLGEVEEKNEFKGEEISTGKSEEKAIENTEGKEAKEPVEEPQSAVGKPIASSAPVSNPVISYNDIIKCLETKIQGINTPTSPLTYLLIPSYRGPC